MNLYGLRRLSWPKVFFYVFILFLMSSVARAWMAEWVYPLEESSLWKKPSYASPSEERQRLQLARWIVLEDPRYEFQLARLYAEGISKTPPIFSVEERTIASTVKSFKEAISKRPMVAEYHAGFALFLQQVGASQERRGHSFLTPDPMRLSEVEVERALFLSPNLHAIRAYAATYFQYRGSRERALHLWRSILEEDPNRTEAILADLFRFYKEPSFLLEVAPRKRTGDLVRFQEFLNTVQRKDWGEGVYLKTLPLLIETAQREPENEELLHMIAKTYGIAGQYQDSYFWYQKAFRMATTQKSRAYVVYQIGDLFMRQRRLLEGRSFLEPHLSLSSFEPGILILYARMIWYLGERSEAIGAIQNRIKQAKEKVPPEWRDELAFFLYEEGRYGEAKRQWRILLEENRGTVYETQNRTRLMRRIQESEQNSKVVGLVETRP